MNPTLKLVLGLLVIVLVVPALYTLVFVGLLGLPVAFGIAASGVSSGVLAYYWAQQTIPREEPHV